MGIYDSRVQLKEPWVLLDMEIVCFLRFGFCIFLEESNLE